MMATVSYVTGEVSTDGARILLRIETEDGEHVDLAFPTIDLQPLVTLLLHLGRRAAQQGRYVAYSETFQGAPMPLHGVSLDMEPDDRGVLNVEVGATVLSFSLSRLSMAEMGRTLLALTAAKRTGSNQPS